MSSASGNGLGLYTTTHKIITQSTPTAKSGPVLKSVLFLRQVGFYALLVGLYVALDAASFIRPMYGLNITPWNPAPALALVFLLLYGQGARLPVLFAVLLSEWLVRDSGLNLVAAALLAVGYLLLGEVLKVRLPPNTQLDTRKILLAWLAIVVVGTLINSLVFISTLDVLGLLPRDSWGDAVLQFWIGDAVGIVVAMPLFWWLSHHKARIRLYQTFWRVETFAYMVLSLLAIWVAFVLGGHDEGFKYFYLLSLPIVWAASRQGMAGAVIAATQLQLSLIITVQWLNYTVITLHDLQVFSLVMALVGFLIGGVVNELRHASSELRQTLRLAAAGEMAGALAHELNQPLTALSAYAHACEHLMQKKETGDRLNSAIHGMLNESGRAAEILGRLRDFFRTGATQLKHVDMADLIESVVVPFRVKAAQRGVVLTVHTPHRIVLLADRPQLAVVLRNLVSNALEAIPETVESAGRPKQVVVSTDIQAGGNILITVEDSGKGLSADVAEQLFEPFQSTKSSGLGLGLVISRAIVETHGGTLWCEPAEHGIFKVQLPILEISESP